MTDTSPLPSLTESEQQAAGEIVRVVIGRLRGDDGVQAEIAVSTTARMAGTYLLRSFGLPISHLEAGTPVASAAPAEACLQLIAAIRASLDAADCRLDPGRIPETVPEDHRSHYSLIQTQLMFGVPFRNTVRRNGLDEAAAARACAEAAARIIKDCSPVLDPHVAFAIASAASLEACRAVPLKVPGDDPEPPGSRRPWYKFW